MKNHFQQDDKTGGIDRRNAGPRKLPLFAFHFPLFKKRASSLITSLLVLVVLSTIVVAFMQSMSIERSVARSAKNTLQAALLADAAIDSVLHGLSAIITNGPYGAIFTQDTNGSPYLFLAKRRLAGTNVVTDRIPLFSTALPLSSFTNLSALPVESSARTISDQDLAGANITRTVNAAVGSIVNLNAPTSVFPNGVVGLMNGASPRSLPVNWIYLNDASGKVVGRYAYWVDDESSKLDLRYAGQAVNASGTHSRGDGTNTTDLSLLVLTNTPANIGASNISNLMALRNLTNMALRSAYSQYSLPGGSAPLSPAEWERLRPYVTVYSLSDDRSPDGKRRLNLNAVVTGTNTVAQIEKEVFAIRSAITNNLPSFGNRYFSTPSPTADDQTVYVTKLAANIRDFIDTNSVATIIQSDGTAYVGNSADFIPFEAVDSDLPAAFGKEAGPFLSEYFRIIRVISPDPHPTSTTPTPITVRFAHYIELSNPTGKTINYADLGPSPYVMLSNRMVWNNTAGGTPSVLRPADIKIRLPTNFTIPPGSFAVLTTDGPPFGTLGVSSSQSDYIGLAPNRYTITAGTDPGQWELVNTGGKATPVGGNYEDYALELGAITTNRYGLQGAVANASYADQRERLLFGNNDGLIDYTLRIFTNRDNYLGRNIRNPAYYGSFLADDSTTSNNTQTGSGTEPRYTRGDVRSNTEASAILSRTTACWRDGSQGYGNTLPANTESLGATNFNTSQNHSGVALWRQGWYEHTSDIAGNHFIANRSIGSVGELGSVYDPIRHSNVGYRSQGATLRIGQSDASTNNRANSSGNDYTNWLGGRGSDDVTTTNSLNNASLLLDVFRTDSITSGKVNPNSIARDPMGLAFRAALDQFTFEAAATNRASSALSGLTFNVTNTLTALQSFATNSSNGYLVSVADLARSPLFWTTNSSLAGVPMLGVSDAGREEFMRRSSNLLSTQSLAFSIFVRAEVGDFVRDSSSNDRFRVKAATTRETVVQLRPTYGPTSDPTIPEPPANWEIVKPRTITY